MSLLPFGVGVAIVCCYDRLFSASSSLTDDRAMLRKRDDVFVWNFFSTFLFCLIFHPLEILCMLREFFRYFAFYTLDSFEHSNQFIIVSMSFAWLRISFWMPFLFSPGPSHRLSALLFSVMASRYFLRPRIVASNSNIPRGIRNPALGSRTHSRMHSKRRFSSVSEGTESDEASSSSNGKGGSGIGRAQTPKVLSFLSLSLVDLVLLTFLFVSVEATEPRVTEI